MGGDLERAETDYRTLLKRNSRDVEARVGLGYVYLWQGRTAAVGRQAGYALAMDSTNKAGGELRQAARVATQASLEPTAYWSNDSDQNTSWQTLAAHVPLGGTVGIYGSVNAGNQRSGPGPSGWAAKRASRSPREDCNCSPWQALVT